MPDSISYFTQIGKYREIMAAHSQKLYPLAVPNCRDMQSKKARSIGRSIRPRIPIQPMSTRSSVSMATPVPAGAR